MNMYEIREKVKKLNLLVHIDYGYYKIVDGLIEYYDSNAELEIVKININK